MSFSRTLYYPMRKACYKHTYFPRRRGVGKRETSKAEENAAAILNKLTVDGKRSENLSRSRRTITDIILCNPFDYFCTFTFNAEKVDRFNYKECKKKITEVFKNYKNRCSFDFRYIIIPEFHKNGGIHFHGMVGGLRKGDLKTPDYIWKRSKKTGELFLVPNTKGYVDWEYYSKKLGFFSCSKVKDYEKCARYVAKYVTKDLMSMPLGQNAYMCSKNLSRPELIFDMDDVPRVFDTPDFKCDFCEIKRSSESYGVVPDWWGEQCSELQDEDYPYSNEDVQEKDALFPRLTGKQLSVAGEC